MAARASRREQAARTRERLVAVARAHWQERGYAEVSIEALLEEAGVARGALYHHFPGKRALFEAVRDEVEAEVLAWMRGASNMPGGPWAELRAACLLYVSACSDPGVRRVLLRDAPALLGPGREPERPVLAALRSRLERALDDAEQAAALAPLLLGALDAAALGPGDREDAESWRTLHTSVTLVLEGLRLVSFQGVLPAVPGGGLEEAAWRSWPKRGAPTPKS